ncbi:photosystem II reaction center W protein, chloroplastic-like [Impatiens glandulifera]|uniref:photosystem II reaction center W protein, chloroplastic-like n=1 Tax=Impatiens glandulifera TaxID=253017 RepID=UPI001FB10729|nr:photosystem II reaction center W protein, chloroplastic-like [Impatiens glandulifera]
MASFAGASSVTATALLQKRSPSLQPSAILGLPAMSKISKVGKVRCSIDQEKGEEEIKGLTTMGKGAALMAAASAAALSSPAMALVDERMSTEGIGLPFGLSNNLLGWILLGVFGLIWALYTVYSGTIDDDEESGLSL